MILVKAETRAFHNELMAARKSLSDLNVQHTVEYGKWEGERRGLSNRVEALLGQVNDSRAEAAVSLAHARAAAAQALPESNQSLIHAIHTGECYQKEVVRITGMLAESDLRFAKQTIELNTLRTFKSDFPTLVDERENKFQARLSSLESKIFMLEAAAQSDPQDKNQMLCKLQEEVDHLSVVLPRVQVSKHSSLC